MRRGLLASVVLVCVICFGALGGVVAAGWSPKLGLDLEGGLSVVFQPVHKATSQQLQTVVGIMQARANGLGLANPNIGSQGNNIVVQLPGVKDFAKVISEIGSTSQLFFRPVLSRGGRLHPGLEHDDNDDDNHDGAEVHLELHDYFVLDHHHDDREGHDHHHDDGAEDEEEAQDGRVRGTAALWLGLQVHDRHLHRG